MNLLPATRTPLLLPPPPTGSLLFVYGTLMRGFGNHHLLSEAPFAGSGLLQGRLYGLGGFPGLKRGEGTVHGEIYRVNDFTRLDRLEGFSPSCQRGDMCGSCFYHRVPWTALLGGRELEVQTYLYLHPVEERSLVADGRWGRR